MRANNEPWDLEGRTWGELTERLDRELKETLKPLVRVDVEKQIELKRC